MVNDSGRRQVCDQVYIGLGSNLGDRARHIDAALARIEALPGTTVLARSRLHETAPVGGPPDQPLYLNAAAQLATQLCPRNLLAALLEIERALGRVRAAPGGPRTIDLDLLVYGREVRDGADLILPHPRMWQRRFVLEPLSEIADLDELYAICAPAAPTVRPGGHFVPEE